MLKIKRIFLILIATLSLVFITSCDLVAIITGGYTVTYETYGLCEVPNETKVTNLPLDLPKPETAGYEFMGWYYDEAFIVEAYGGDLIVEDTTLYAHWNRLTYTVTFENTKGETVKPLKDVTKIPNLPVLEIEGFNFAGWYYDNEYKNPVNVGDDVVDNITVYAKWNVKRYNIIFNTKGHGENVPGIEDVTALPDDLPVLKEEGFNFLGWYLDEQFTVSAESGKQITSNVTLYAKWQELFNIIYDCNNHGTALDSVYNQTKLPQELPTLSETGYEFVGWYYDKSFTKEAKANDELTSDVTLYAKWKANEYKVLFDLNGASGSVTSIDAEYGKELIIPKCDVSYTGYKFVCWNTKADGSGNTYYELSKVGNLTTNETITLYAIWEKQNYTFTVKLNNGTEDLVYTLGYNEVLPRVTSPTKPNAEFNGWYTIVNGAEVEFDFTNATMPDSNLLIFAKYIGEVSIAFTINGTVNQLITGIKGTEISTTIIEPSMVGHTFEGWFIDQEFVTPFNSNIFPNENLTVYGKMTVNNVVINFNANGGTGTMAPQTIVYGSGVALKGNTFTRTGYKFNGWSISSSSTTVDYIDGYSKDIISTGSITLYAVWERLVYNVTFVTNGHGEQPAQLREIYQLPSTLPILVEEKFIFVGWYYDDEFTNQAKVNDIITNDTILYAKWEQEKEATPEPTEKIIDNIIYDDFQIYFLELGNGNSGDSVYIKAGNVDVLIDAGSKRNSTSTLISHINKYRSPGDDMIDYVIATHAHEDHIAGFVGESNVTNDGILYEYKIGTIIDFAYKNTTSGVSSEYIRVRDDLVSKGTIHYTAAQCFNQTDGAKQTYELADGITMSILYNYYYFNKTSDENDYSVCTMFTYNDHNFMFTGDLEKGGEQKLAAYYDGSTPAKTLPQVEVFKAGHHGSNTSSNDYLLEKIRPEIVCVCCCAGGSEYTKNYENTFPTQAMINRVAQYTDRLYATTCYNIAKRTYESLNGIIIISSNGTSVGVSATNNIKKIKDSEWFNTTIYAKSDGTYCSSSTNYYTAATSGATARPQRVWPSN